MKKPLNFAMLKYMTTVEKANPAQVIEALKADYAGRRELQPNGMLIAMMTAKENGLLEEHSYELDANGELVMYFTAPAECADEINRYIPD